MTINELYEKLDEFIKEGKGDYDVMGSTCDGAEYFIEKLDIRDEWQDICLTNEYGD